MTSRSRGFVNTPARGIGDTSLERIGSYGVRPEMLAVQGGMFKEKFADYGLKPAAVAKIRSFCEMINGFAAKEATTNADELALGISNACGLYAFFKNDPSIEAQSRASNVEELIEQRHPFH